MQLIHNRIRPASELNMTPMIDIVFLLIIFFLVISDFQHREFEKIDLPKTQVQGVADDADKRLVVNVRADGGITVDSNEYTVVQLEKLLIERGKGIAGSPGVLLRADRSAPWRVIRPVFWALASQHVMHLEVAVREQQESGR